MAGLGQLVRDWTSFVCGGDIEERGGCGIANTYTQSRPQFVHTTSYTRSHHLYTLCTVAKLAAYMEWPVATRVIDRLRECVLLYWLLYSAQPRVAEASTRNAERAKSRILGRARRLAVYPVIGANRHQLLSRCKD